MSHIYEHRGALYSLKVLIGFPGSVKVVLAVEEERVAAKVASNIFKQALVALVCNNVLVVMMLQNRARVRSSHHHWVVVSAVRLNGINLRGLVEVFLNDELSLEA